MYRLFKNIILIYNINKIRDNKDFCETPALNDVFLNAFLSKQSLTDRLITKLFIYLIIYKKNPLIIKVSNNLL